MSAESSPGSRSSPIAEVSGTRTPPSSSIMTGPVLVKAARKRRWSPATSAGGTACGTNEARSTRFASVLMSIA